MAAVMGAAGSVQASRYSRFETLRNGTRIEIRAQKPEDRAELVAAFGRLAEQSRYTRFFAPKRSLSEAEIAHFTNVDFFNHVALVAVTEGVAGRRIVGACRYFVTQPGSAEMAFAVDDAHQGLGIASALIRNLAAIARAARLDTLQAEVLAENAPMLKVFERCGLGISKKHEQGVVHVTLRLGTGESAC